MTIWGQQMRTYIFRKYCLPPQSLTIEIQKNLKLLICWHLKLNTCAGYQKKTDPLYIGNGQCQSKICVDMFNTMQYNR